jgi:2,3-bisphosphoglycerate-dependent phosphoglycerate mutase
MTMYLIRHAMPAVDPTTDPATWPLGAEGRAVARTLGVALPARAVLIASDEPKAWQTLAPDGERDVIRDRRFGEVRRAEAFSDDFRHDRRRYVDGARIDNWEPRETAVARFATAVGDARHLAGERDLVIATHGMAMTLWLTSVLSLPDPVQFWDDLRFPDLFRVGLRTGAATRIDWTT